MSIIAHLTPPALARAIVRALPIQRGQSIVEPHVGSGAFVDALARPWVEGDPDVLPSARPRAPGLQVQVGDLNPDATGLLPRQEVIDAFGHFRAYRGVDFLTTNPWSPPDWIVGNCPWGNKKTGDLSEQHVRRSFDVIRPGGSIVYLLQGGFTFGQGRYDRIWRSGSGVPRPFHVWHVVGRPNFETINDPSPKKGTEDGGNNKYDYLAIWWNTAVPDARTTLDWLVWK